jgi:hypothetical protein
MGLIKFIREKLPEPLEIASRQLRMKEQLVQRINSVVPQCYKNKYHYKEGISKVKMIFFHWERGTDIYRLIDMTNVDNLTKWKELEQIARNYKYQCE